MKGIHIGEVLVEQGAITKEQLNEGLKQLKAETNDRRLAEVLTELGYITDRELMEVLGRSMGLEVIDLEFFHIDERAVEKIPKQLAIKYNIMAVSMEGSCLTVATADPLDLYALEDIRLVTNMRILLILAERTQIRHAIELNYSGIDARAAARLASEHAVFSRTFAENLMVSSDEDQAPIVRLLNSLLLKGYNTNASDIHIEPYENETVVRMRRDGMLIPYMTLSPAIHQGIVARTKILAKMDIAEKRKSQDGHFKVTLDGREMNVRVSFVPTLYGEKGVLRFLTTNTPIDRSAAITGHLVFSTLHTNDAASSVTRLMDMGIPAYLAAASIAGIVSQRLMRKVCPYCQEEYEARPEELKILYGKPAAPGEHVRLRRGKGCYLCNETGYKGRIAIHEILSVDAEMKRMISEGRKEDELKAYAIRSHGMTTLKEEAVKMVLAGITTFEEMERLVYTIDMDYFGED